MSVIRDWIATGLSRQPVEHAARTTAGAGISFLLAHALGLPEAYWATITTIIVAQSTLGAAWTISMRRLAGTALGAALAALLAAHFGLSVIAFSAGIFAAGLICSLLHLDRSAYRFAAITMSIVMLVIRLESPWMAATHRFVEVAVGIAVGLALAAVWPERDSSPAGPLGKAPRAPSSH